MSFASDFETAHIDHGEYYGFDSIVGKTIRDQYFPAIYGEPEDPECVLLFLYNKKLNRLPKLILVATKETLL